VAGRPAGVFGQWRDRESAQGGYHTIVAAPKPQIVGVAVAANGRAAGAAQRVCWLVHDQDGFRGFERRSAPILTRRRCAQPGYKYNLPAAAVCLSPHSPCPGLAVSSLAVALAPSNRLFSYATTNPLPPGPPAAPTLTATPTYSFRKPPGPDLENRGPRIGRAALLLGAPVAPHAAAAAAARPAVFVRERVG
jgi:hypothetical protein